MSQCSTGNPPNGYGPLMTVAEFCDWAKVGKTFLYAEVAANRLRIHKLASKTVIRREDAEAWLINRLIPAGQEGA
jgi:excisionase family DNA binding protein